MEIAFKITKITNFVGLLFLLLGAWGIALTGILQVASGIIFLILFPKNQCIYIYFSLVLLFFIAWNGSFDWFFSIPIFLIFFLTYIIHTQKIKPQNSEL